MEVGVRALNSLLVNSPPDRVVLGRVWLCLVFLGKTPPSVSLSTEMRNWVPVNLMPGKPAMD